MSSAAEPEQVELRCPHEGCDFVAVGAAKGKGSAALKLGGHRSNKHGYRNPNGPRKQTPKEKAFSGAPGAGDEAPTPLRVVREAAGEISQRTTRAPSEEELARATARLLSTASVAAASYMAETDPWVQSDEDIDTLVDHLSLTASEAREIGYPIARSLARTEINKRYGRAIVDNIDVASAAADLGSFALRWRRYMRLRAGGGPGALPARAAPPPAPAPVPVPVVDEPAGPAGPAPRPGVGNGEMAGQVWTPEMVQMLAARHG